MAILLLGILPHFGSKLSHRKNKPLSEDGYLRNSLREGSIKIGNPIVIPNFGGHLSNYLGLNLEDEEIFLPLVFFRILLE